MFMYNPRIPIIINRIRISQEKEYNRSIFSKYLSRLDKYFFVLKKFWPKFTLFWKSLSAHFTFPLFCLCFSLIPFFLFVKLIFLFDLNFYSYQFVFSLRDCFINN